MTIVLVCATYIIGCAAGYFSMAKGDLGWTSFFSLLFSFFILLTADYHAEQEKKIQLVELNTTHCISLGYDGYSQEEDLCYVKKEY